MRVTGLTDGVSAVVFDFFGTLTPDTPDEVWLDQASRVAAVIGVDGQTFRTVLHESFPERATGAMGDLPHTMQALAHRLGVQLTAERLKVTCRVRRRAQRELFALRQDALPVIHCLQAMGLKIGVLSDCTTELPEAWPELPVSAVVDAAVFSCIVGILKPDPRLFAQVSADLGVDPADCLYVGDGGGRELSGARAVGMRAVLLTTANRHSNPAYDREEDWDGPSIGSIDALCR